MTSRIINHHGNVEEVSAPAFTPGPWFAGKLLGDDEQGRTISVGPYSLADRPNKDAHYEDTICEVWDNPNLGEYAEANAALVATSPELYASNEYAATVLREIAAILRGAGLSGCADICIGAADRIGATLAKARND